jgi:flavin reductase (DIM6/NTAB) family NADH-FMN oxidoreductase RutF
MLQMTIHVETPTAGSGTMDDLQFCSIMRATAASVMVITTGYNGQLHGMTATAFSSVSAEPPTVLIVLNRSTRTHPMVSASGHFVVNLLAEDQAHLGNRFAGKLDNQFDGIGYTLSDRGAPIINGAVATLECETVGATDFGTHTIFIGKVLKGTRSEVLPLLYHDGGYKGITRRG